MILTRIKLENYGLFSGPNEFDLRPRVKYHKLRPIILFGGKNGSGKTTFLDAIRLLLYGRKALGNRLSQKEYEEFLLNRVHRNKQENTRENFAKIALEFEHVVGGEKQIFFVERSWIVTRQGAVTEYFRVLRNGSTLDDMSPEHLEAFISDIVPERLSQLFFFDGEKIKGIAEDFSSNAAIADAIQSLLGLDAVLSLKSDLAVYRTRLLKKANPEEFERQLMASRTQEEALKRQIDHIDDSLAELATQIDGLICTVQSIESELEQRGGSFAGRRSDNQQKADEIKGHIQASEASIRECFEGALPFAVCPSISSALVAQLEKEDGLRELEIAHKQLDRIREFLDQAAKKEDRSSGIRTFVEKQFAEYGKNLGASANAKIIHGLSSRDTLRLCDLLTSGVEAEAEKAMRLLDRLESQNRSLYEITRDLEKAPDEVDVKELFERLSLRNTELGSLRGKQQSLNGERRKLENEQATLARLIAQLEARIKVGEKEAAKLDQIKRLGPALDAYRERLTQVKILTLQAEVTECFNRLARKNDFVKGILINPDTFQVTLLDQHGRSMPKEDLSSGEKQIFAIAMLWGLARTSGRPLPVVVDTPLGRLDSDHRANLIENYFAHAGHQVILLSTDTEVDQGLFKQLSPSVSHCYHLSYDHKAGKTNSTEEYFWRN